MYVRRAASRSLPRRRPPQLQRRWLTTTDSPPPPPPPLTESSSLQSDVTARDTDNRSATPVSPAKPTYSQTAIESEVEATSTRSRRRRGTHRVFSKAYDESSTDGPGLTIHVTPVQNALSMPGLLALVRELEQRFGDVREFRVLRDKDSPSDYLKSLYVCFESRESVQNIQKTLQDSSSGTIMVQAPPAWDRSKELEGGISLNEILPYLRRANSVESTATELAEQIKEVSEVSENLQELMKSRKEMGLELHSVSSSSNDDEPVDDPKQDTTSNTSTTNTTTAPNADSTECRIVILQNDSISHPQLHTRPWAASNSERNQQVTRSFITWGGFYPHYHFTASSNTNDPIDDLNIPEHILQKLPSDSQKAQKRVQIHEATLAMRAALLRQHTRLLKLDAPDHGLIFRNGEKLVVDWLPEDDPERPQRTKAEHDEDEHAILKERKWAKPNITPEEEEMEELWKPLFGQHENASVRSPKRKRPKPSVKQEKTSSERDAPSTPQSSASESQQIPPASPVMSSPEPEIMPEEAPSPQPNTSTTVTLEEAKTAIKEETSIEAPAGAAPETTDSEENNRARRAKKKADREEREGFKAKLLGWLGR